MGLVSHLDPDFGKQHIPGPSGWQAQTKKHPQDSRTRFLCPASEKQECTQEQSPYQTHWRQQYKRETENGRKAKLKTRHPTPNISVEKKDLYTVNQHDVMTPSHAWTFPSPSQQRAKEIRSQVSQTDCTPETTWTSYSHKQPRSVHMCSFHPCSTVTHQLEAASLQAALSFHLLAGGEPFWSHCLHHLATIGSFFYDISH